MQVLGADGLLYQSIDDLLAVAQSLNPDIQQFEASCFTGKIYRIVHATANTFLDRMCMCSTVGCPTEYLDLQFEPVLCCSCRSLCH